VFINTKIKTYIHNAFRRGIAMVQVSVEMITKGEPNTEYVLKSIQQQTFRDYDVTCVNPSSSLLMAYRV
jgi:hypothetical protein